MLTENKIFNQLTEKFKKNFDNTKELIYLRAPGRVNLIGEHTDYNNGFVFPSAINLEIYGVAGKRNDSLIQAYSLDFEEMKSFDINQEIEKENSWLDYIKGVIKELKNEGEIESGANIIFKSTLPVGSGLSSSAAFELINAQLFSNLNSVEISKKDLALLCQRAENKFVGVNCGIMDQFAIALSKEDSALFLDTMTLDYETVSLNLSEYKIMIGNTNKPRTLADSAYNERRQECETAVRILQGSNNKIESLRDADIKMLEENKSQFSQNIYQRAKHVITENKRVIDSVTALKENNLKKFGELMVESHKSLKDLYEVSCKELDVMVEEALKIDGVLGSRMTGAGFGGCTVSIVRNNKLDMFINTVGKNYEERTSLKPEFYTVTAVDGAEITKNS